MATYSALLASPRSVDSGEAGIEAVNWRHRGLFGICETQLRAGSRYSHALLWLTVKPKGDQTSKAAKQPTWHGEQGRRGMVEPRPKEKR